MNAPQITIADIHNKIKAATYTLLSDGRTTICQLMLENGYTVIGTSACVSAENYNQAIGEKFAFEDAVNAIWPLEGYLLREKLHRASSSGNPPSNEHPLDKIARLCHEVNRAYCQALGDNSQVPWEEAPEWQRESARMGVDLHLMGDFGPEASHLSWMNVKVQDGWTYGSEKDVNKKEHPCMVPFSELPREQQAKDYIFRAIVHCFKPKGGDPVGKEG